jgi:thioredoxin 1
MENIIVTKQNFNEEVVNSNKTVILDFFATWCGPCQMLAPVLEKIAEENKTTM